VKDLRTTLIGVSLILAAAAFCAFTKILDTSEGKALVTGMTMTGLGLIAAKDAH
jgi:hypothetical protein